MSEPKTPPAPRKTIEEQLDEALADSFPASDPVSFVTSQTEEDWNEAPADCADAQTPAPPSPKAKP